MDVSDKLNISGGTNDLVCFTNCLLVTEDGTLTERDLWIDQVKGVVLDSQTTFYVGKQRPDTIVDLGGNVLSPGFLDIQINGAYGFDFSVYDGDDDSYKAGLRMVTEKIVETGVTSFVPTIVTQEKFLYPKLLRLLRPFCSHRGANMLGWHAEGPFLEPAKRGAHASLLLRPAHEGFKSFEDVYGVENLVEAESWLHTASAGGENGTDVDVDVGVRIVTAAPEIPGIMEALPELTSRGVIFAIGHSAASSDIATAAVTRGARLITHLFNAMSQLHHRDPSIIGLLGVKPQSQMITPSAITAPRFAPARRHADRKVFKSEAFTEVGTPLPGVKPMPTTAMTTAVLESASVVLGEVSRPSLVDASTGIVNTHPNNYRNNNQTTSPVFQKPFYDIIVDGIHLHPNSVRLAYSSYPEGCILITDAMKALDPRLCDGIHEWRDGQRVVKEGDKLYLEGTNTLAGSVVTLDKCVRNFSQFTGCSLGEAIKCVTYNPAKCLGIENKKGTLRPGADADLVVLDGDGHVMSTWVKGRKMWTRTVINV